MYTIIFNMTEELFSSSTAWFDLFLVSFVGTDKFDNKV